MLENKIAPKLRYHDKHLIYGDLGARTALLSAMVADNVLDYDAVNLLLDDYYEHGLEGVKLEWRA